MAETTTTAPPESGGVVDWLKSKWHDVSTAMSGGIERTPEQLAAREVGDLKIPEATAQGLKGWQITGMEKAGFSRADVELIDDLKRRYPNLKLEGSIGVLVENESLREDVMKVLHSSETAPHVIAQQLDGNAELTAQLEDMARHNPDKLKELLPEIEKDPSKFSELISTNGRDPKVAAEANAEAAKGEGLKNMMKLFTGEITLKEALDGIQPGMYNMLKSMPLMGPLIGMVENMLGSDGFIGQAMNGNGPFAQFAQMMGVDPNKVHDANPTPAPDAKPSPSNDPHLIANDPGLAIGPQ